MKKSSFVEKVLWLCTVVLCVMSCVMVPMLIFDANPWQDTMYDVLIIILGVGALLIGTLSSIDGRAQRQATMKIQEEIKAAVKELRVLDTENDKILNELEKDEELDREMIKKIDDKL